MHNAPDDYLNRRNPIEDEEEIDITWWGLQQSERNIVIETLTDEAHRDLKALVWADPQETRVISVATATLHIAEDTQYTRKVIERAMYGGDVEDELLTKCRNIIKEQIDEAMCDYEALPEGYKWEDFDK